MKRMFLLAGVIAFIASCNQSPKMTTAPAKGPSADSLATVFSNEWNKADSDYFYSAFSPNAVVADNNTIAVGADSIKTRWTQPNLRSVKNLKFTPLQSWSTPDMASFTGYFDVDVALKDTTFHGKGAFTMIWKKSNDGSWRITTGMIHDFTPSM